METAAFIPSATLKGPLFVRDGTYPYSLGVGDAPYPLGVRRGALLEGIAEKHSQEKTTDNLCIRFRDGAIILHQIP